IADHPFFHISEFPRQIPSQALTRVPNWTLPRPVSEMNWRIVTTNAGIGPQSLKTTAVGAEAGKSLAAYIPTDPAEPKLGLTGPAGRTAKYPITKLKEQNILPLALSPRHPA